MCWRSITVFSGPASSRCLEAAVCNGAGVAAADLVVTYSHTHAAGLMGLERVALPGGELIAPYLDDLGRRLAGLVTDARHTTNAAVLGYATGRCSLAAHRDYWDAAAGEWVCGFNPEGPTDDTVVTVRITDRAGRIVATVVNYACHPRLWPGKTRTSVRIFRARSAEVVETATGCRLAFSCRAPRAISDREKGSWATSPSRIATAGNSLMRPVCPGIAAPAFHPVPVRGGRGFGNKAWPVGARRPLCRGNGGKTAMGSRRRSVDLPYRAGIVRAAEARAGLAQWQEEHKAAQRRGDQEHAQTSRAMIEQMERSIVRTASLPPATLTRSQSRSGRWRRLLGRG